MDRGRAVIIGAGDGLSASLARELARDHRLTLAARSGERMTDVAKETGAETVLLGATDEVAVKALFDALPEPPRVVVYNPSMRLRGPVAELAAEDVRRVLEVTAIGAFLTGKHAARVGREHGPRVASEGCSRRLDQRRWADPGPWAGRARGPTGVDTATGGHRAHLPAPDRAGLQRLVE